MALAWPVLQLYVIFDTLQGEAQAVVRGAGQQKLGSYLTSSAYWVFGIEISLVSSFYWDCGIAGIWFGPCFAVLYLTVTYNMIIKCINWNDIVEKSKERRAKEQLNREAIKARALERAAKKGEDQFARN